MQIHSSIEGGMKMLKRPVSCYLLGHELLPRLSLTRAYSAGSPGGWGKSEARKGPYGA